MPKVRHLHRFGMPSALLGIGWLVVSSAAIAQAGPAPPSAPHSVPPSASTDTAGDGTAAVALDVAATIDAPDAARLRAQIERIEADVTLDTAVREALLVESNATLALLERAARRRARITALERQAANRDRILDALAQTLSEPLPTARAPGPEADIATLAADAALVEDKLVSAIGALVAARRDEAQLSARAPQIAREIAQALRRGENPASAAPNATGAIDEVDTTGTLVEQSQALMQELRWREGVTAAVELRRELATLPAQRSIASARALLAGERLTRLTRVLERRQAALGNARVSEAAEQVVAAAAIATAADTDAERGTDGALALPNLDEALSNLALARRRLDVVRQERQDVRQLARVRADVVELHGVRSIIDGMAGSGLDADDLAGLLRGLDERLPDGQTLLAERQAAARARSALQAERFGWNERLRARSVQDPRGVAAALTAERDGPPGTADAHLGTTGLLLALIEDADRLSDLLTGQEIAQQESIVRADHIETFLSRSLLGLRTDESAGLAWLARLPAGAARLTDRVAWRGIVAAQYQSMTRFALRALIFAALVAALLLLRPWLRRRLGELAARVGNVGQDRHWVTPAALLLSLPRALPAPLVLGLAGLQLDLSSERGELASALGDALTRIAPLLFAILLLRVFARHDGLLHAHFGWSLAAARALRRHLLWLGWIALTAGLLLVLAFDAGDADLRHGVGVAALLITSLGLAAFMHVCFRPSRGVVAMIDPDRATPRVMVALYPLLLLAPLAIGALPLIGYFDTAVELQLRLVESLLLVVATVVVYGLARRAYLVAHRRLSLRRVREWRARRERERDEEAAQPVTGQASPASLDDSEEVSLDLARVERQTRRILVDVATIVMLLGLWLVWRSLLPAFDATGAGGTGLTGVTGQAAGGPGQLPVSVAASAGVDAAAIAPGGISLRGVVLAMFLIAIGLIASRNLRGLLEIAVFERLRLDAGARYAIVAITGYVLVGASLVAGLSQLGVDWSKLQWIVAALGVGLGFGLQEIVANFVSGLIILFERPIRVGDVVTIGNLSGTVSNIRIRATTVTNFDNLEVMLPNKTIITENVTNWTLSDSVTRIILSVGVAFDADVERVRSLLEGAIRATEDILDEPEWTVFFMRYGENALIFELRVFVPTPEYRLPVTHALNARLNAALTDAGIEIPHPQRSVVLRKPGTGPVVRR